MGLTPWYIDAWSVLDGMAFASLRPPRDWAASCLEPATTTVLIGPPDWRAVGIAKLTTALAATRGTFQEGVFDENEEEIPFDSLDDVREVVRRAYLAGGLGLDDPGEAAPVTPDLVPRPGGQGTWEEIRHGLAKIETEVDRRRLARQMIALFQDADVRHQSTACGERLMFAIEVWQKSSGRDSKSDQLGRRQFRWIAGHLFFGPSSLPYVYPVTSQQRLRLLFRLPAMGSYPNLPQPRTLADQLLLAFASRDCVESVKSLEQFLPLAVGALIAAAAADPGPFGQTDFPFEPWLEPAMTWFVSALPRRVNGAPERMSEELIGRIAAHKLGFGGAHGGGRF